MIRTSESSPAAPSKKHNCHDGHENSVRHWDNRKVRVQPLATAQRIFFLCPLTNTSEIPLARIPKAQWNKKHRHLYEGTWCDRSLDFRLYVLFLGWMASIHSLSEFRWQIVIISANQWADDRLSWYKPLFSLLMVLTQSEASTSQNGSRWCMLTAVWVQQYSIQAEVIALIALTANICVCFNCRENKLEETRAFLLSSYLSPVHTVPLLIHSEA